MEKEEALARFLDCSKDEAEKLINDGEYLVLTDAEADTEAKARILDTIWAFNKWFLDAHSKVIKHIPDEIYKKLQEECEGINEMLIESLEDKDSFVEDAIASDGRGHFLSSYDGKEYQEGEYFIYRQ